MEDQALRQAFAQGERAWPGIQLELEAFRGHCERVLGPAPEWDWTRFGTELFLCCACAQGDSEAMRVLESETLPQVVKAISRIDSDTSTPTTESHAPANGITRRPTPQPKSRARSGRKPGIK